MESTAPVVSVEEKPRYEIAVYSRIFGKRYLTTDLPRFSDDSLAIFEEECRGNIHYLLDKADGESRNLDPVEGGRIRRNRMMLRAIEQEKNNRNWVKKHKLREDARIAAEAEREARKAAKGEARALAEVKRAERIKDASTKFLDYYTSRGLPTDIDTFKNFIRKVNYNKAKLSALHDVIYERFGTEVASEINREARARAERVIKEPPDCEPA